MRINYSNYKLNEGYYKSIKGSYDKETKTIEVESNFIEFDFDIKGEITHIKLMTSNDKLEPYVLVIDDCCYFGFCEEQDLDNNDLYKSKKFNDYYKNTINNLNVDSKTLYKMLKVNFSNKEKLEKIIEMKPELFMNLKRYN